MLTAAEVSQLEGLLAKARAAGVEPKPRAKTMTEADFLAHIASSEQEHDWNAEYDRDPRGAVFVLEDRVEALEKQLAELTGQKAAKKVKA